MAQRFDRILISVSPHSKWKGGLDSMLAGLIQCQWLMSNKSGAVSVAKVQVVVLIRMPYRALKCRFSVSRVALVPT